MKHFIDLSSVTTAEMKELLELAAKLKSERKQGIAHPLLAGKTLGMIFAKSSTRTRVSFEAGMYQLGGYPLILNTNDIQLGRGETVHDTAKVLSRYIDAIMIRTFSQRDVEDLAKYGSIPVINALTDDTHPCQIMADLLTIQESKGRLEGLRLAYIGDGNNVANTLLQGCTKVGMHVAIATPDGYQCEQKYVNEAKETAQITGSIVTITKDPVEAATDADVLYTDTWVSMGMEAEKASRIELFKDYQINGALAAHAKPDAIFLHCLPAYRGLEVSEEVIDGPQSLVFDEAENRLHAQKAILVKLLA